MAIPNTDEYFQMQVQRSSDELFQEINKLKTPKDFLLFSSNLIKNLNKISIEPREFLSHEKIQKEEKKKNYFYLSEKIIFNNFLFLFFEKQKIFFNPSTFKNFSLDELDNIKKFLKEEKFKKIIKFIKNDESKNFFLFSENLKECIEKEFQSLLEECKFESVYKHKCNSFELIAKKLHFFKYLLLSYYFINVFSCSRKVQGMLETIERLISQNDDLNDYLEYQIELLQLIYNFTKVVDTFFTIGIMENVNPDLCIDQIPDFQNNEMFL